MNIPGSLQISCALCSAKLLVNYVVTIGNRYYDRSISKVSSDQEYTGWIFCVGCRKFDCCANCRSNYDNIKCDCMHNKLEDVGLYRRIAIAIVSRGGVEEKVEDHEHESESDTESDDVKF